jgi:hypothetical protein
VRQYAFDGIDRQELLTKTAEFLSLHDFDIANGSRVLQLGW